MRNIARSSHLTIRFYQHDGWTPDFLRDFIKRGELRTWDKDLHPYSVLSCGSAFDAEKLAPHISQLHTWDGKVFVERAVIQRYIEDFNW